MQIVAGVVLLALIGLIVYSLSGTSTPKLTEPATSKIPVAPADTIKTDGLSASGTVDSTGKTNAIRPESDADDSADETNITPAVNNDTTNNVNLLVPKKVTSAKSSDEQTEGETGTSVAGVKTLIEGTNAESIKKSGPAAGDVPSELSDTETLSSDDETDCSSDVDTQVLSDIKENTTDDELSPNYSLPEDSMTPFAYGKKQITHFIGSTIGYILNSLTGRLNADGNQSGYEYMVASQDDTAEHPAVVIDSTAQTTLDDVPAAKADDAEKTAEAEAESECVTEVPETDKELDSQQVIPAEPRTEALDDPSVKLATGPL